MKDHGPIKLTAKEWIPLLLLVGMVAWLIIKNR